jgi:hypothetical protein
MLFNKNGQLNDQQVQAWKKKELGSPIETVGYPEEPVAVTRIVDSNDLEAIARLMQEGYEIAHENGTKILIINKSK